MKSARSDLVRVEMGWMYPRIMPPESKGVALPVCDLSQEEEIAIATPPAAGYALPA
jgi:hypothetical protein